MIKKLFLIGVVLVLSAGNALACRGTTEYPETAKALEETLKKSGGNETLKRLFERGRRLHEEGHATKDISKARESLRILDDVKKQIGQ